MANHIKNLLWLRLMVAVLVIHILRFGSNTAHAAERPIGPPTRAGAVIYQVGDSDWGQIYINVHDTDVQDIFHDLRELGVVVADRAGSHVRISFEWDRMPAKYFIIDLARLLDRTLMPLGYHAVFLTAHYPKQSILIVTSLHTPAPAIADLNFATNPLQPKRPKLIAGLGWGAVDLYWYLRNDATFSNSALLNPAGTAGVAIRPFPQPVPDDLIAKIIAEPNSDQFALVATPETPRRNMPPVPLMTTYGRGIGMQAGVFNRIIPRQVTVTMLLGGGVTREAYTLKMEELDHSSKLSLVLPVPAAAATIDLPPQMPATTRPVLRAGQIEIDSRIYDRSLELTLGRGPRFGAVLAAKGPENADRRTLWITRDGNIQPASLANRRPGQADWSAMQVRDWLKQLPPGDDASKDKSMQSIWVYFDDEATATTQTLGSALATIEVAAARGLPIDSTLTIFVVLDSLDPGD